MRKNRTIKIIAVLVVVTLLLSSFVPLAFASEKPVLKDIDTHWSKESVEWAIKKGFVTGYPDKTFKPDNLVSEEEFLAMLVRAYHPEIGNAKERWSENYYDFAYEKNYPVKGYMYRDAAGKKHWPQSLGDINDIRKSVPNRLQIAELIAATQGFNYTGDDAVRFILGEKLAKGKNPNEITIRSYDKEGKLSRAEAVQFIKNVIEGGKEELAVMPKEKSDSSKLKEIPHGNKVYGNVVFGEYVAPPNRPLLEPDPLAHEILIETVKSISINGNVVSFAIPNLPKDYTITYKYMDKKTPDSTQYDHFFFENDRRTGGDFEFEYYGNAENTQLTLSIHNEKKTESTLDAAYISIPSLNLKTVFAGWNE